MAKVGFLLADTFHDTEMKNPYEAIKEAGHETVIIGEKTGVDITAKQGTISYQADVAADQISAADLDAIVIPGGSAPEKLRINEHMVRLVKEMNEQGKLIAGICHGPQVMISADILRNRKATCFIGIRDDIKNAGAEYLDQEVVVDGNLVTSRTPKDEPAFIREILNKLG